jgi:hypothetical protein
MHAHILSHARVHMQMSSFSIGYEVAHVNVCMLHAGCIFRVERQSYIVWKIALPMQPLIKECLYAVQICFQSITLLAYFSPGLEQMYAGSSGVD